MLIFGEYSLGFDTWIVKLVLEYPLRSCDPAHMMYLSSGSNTMKAVEFQRQIFLSGTYCHVCIIKSL